MDPLSLSEVALLVGLVNGGGRSGRWWSQKARAILALATYLDGEWWNGPDVERLTGIPAAHARRLLLDLERQKVITRDGGHATRSKVFWCQVNPEWRSWEVEWSMPARDVELRLAFAREMWARQPLERLFSRPAGARSHRVIALLSARAFDRERAMFKAGIARGARAITEHGSRAVGARSRGRRSEEVSLLQRAATEISSYDPAAKAAEEEGRQAPGWAKVRWAYCQHVGKRAVWGKPEAALARLVAAHGPDRVLEAIDQAPDELGVGLLVDELIRVLALGPDDVEQLATVTPLPHPEELAERRRQLEQMVATYEAEGAPAPLSVVEELARWQDDVEQLEEG